MLWCAFMVNAMAQEQENETAAIYLGPFDIVPTIGLNVSKDDNIFSQTNGNETSSTLTLIKPAISGVASDGVVQYRFNYEIEDGSYSDIHNNDYTDHTIDLGFDWRADIRHLLELSTTFERGHDSRSPDSVTGIGLSELNEYEDRGVGARYTFGAEGSKGRIVIDYQNQRLHYTTNVDATQVLDSDSETIGASLLIAVGAVTRAVFQVTNVDTEFNNNALRNRQDRSFLVGAEWDVNGLMKGALKLGRTDNDLLNTTGDTSQSIGEGSVEWTPYEYSTFTLTASDRTENPSNNVGSFVKRRETGLAWLHDWSDAFYTQLSFSQSRDAFAGVNRNDDTNTLQFGINYTVRRWLNLGVAFSVEEKRSSDSTVEFDRNMATFFLSANL
ncbi:hypothetical protein AB835_10445 [Candidatus Endobugula sertula]|uniref:Outer membrane beta-barrel protein n=1 Tax=Candidatus Endobugula sertula TaxID=62101 RepID=A0A1D2QNI1_9GAMM|nr:hypothetical protein AB835_10445 [Candidatus Endobugula sertula]